MQNRTAGLPVIALGSRPMEAHLPLRRLLEVASADDLMFTQEEFNHLKECAECFNEWTNFIHSASTQGIGS